MKSIRRRLIVSLLAGFILLLGSGEAAVYLVTRAGLQRESDAALLARARAMASMVSQDDGKIQTDFPEEVLAEFSSKQNVLLFEIRTANGELVKSSQNGSSAELQDGPGLLKTPSFWNATISQRPARSVGFLFLPQQEENDEDGKKVAGPPVPWPSIVLTGDQSALGHTLERLLVVLAGVGALALAGTVLLVALLVPAGLRPLDEIGRQAARIDASTLGSRFPFDTVPVELQPVCERLNDLLARLHESFRREQRFSSDVAHELRTPVAELRALAEVAGKWPPGEAEAARAFQDALDIARKMDGIVTGLLTLVRCEEGRQSLRNEPLAVRPLIEKVWAPFASRAEKKRLEVVIHTPEELLVRSDSAALEIILANLFSNAVEYAPAGGSIEIAAQPGDRGVAIRCLNSAHDLEPGDLPYLCERFWRKDSARHDSSHSGLGLAISQQFARHLGTELRMELLSRRRFQVSIELPGMAASTKGVIPGRTLETV